MSDSEHLRELAPFPWRSHKIGTRPHLYRLVDAQDLTVLLVPGKENTGTGDRAKEIAEYVFSAANSHEELLAAAKGARDVLGSTFAYVDPQFHDKCMALVDAIKKVEGSKS